ncbi:hypothetical protein Tco_0385542, partial [Tanacetum coccineum]
PLDDASNELNPKPDLVLELQDMSRLGSFHHLLHRYRSKNLQQMLFGSCLSIVLDIL